MQPLYSTMTFIIKRFFVLTIPIADSIISILAFLIAYGISVVITRALAAWVISFLGDSTAKELGFTSLNPLVHLDFLGFLFFYLIGLGWKKNLPIDTEYLGPRFRTLRILAAFLIESIIHMVIATIGIALLAALFGIHIFYVALPMVARYEHLSHRVLMATYPTLPSLALVIALILILIVYVNTMFAALSLLLNAVRYGLSLVMARYPDLEQLGSLLLIVSALLFLIFFAEPLRIFIIQIIYMAGILLGAGSASA